MREETMKNGRTLLKYILYAVALAVLAEFMMNLDHFWVHMGIQTSS